MASIKIGPFLGAYLAPRPKLLPDHIGTDSQNHWPDRGDLRPWRVPLAHTTIGSSKKTISMLGRDAKSDAIYWFEWTSVVHAVRSFRADDSTKRTYYTGDGAPKVTDNIIGLAGAPYPTAYRDLGIPRPATLPTLTQTVAGTGTDETRYYAYTYLSDWDEEGPPAVSAPITVKPGALLNITTLAAPPSGAGENRGINRIRIYRTVAGATGAAFYFLREITVATSTTDDARATGVDTLPSTYYDKPPTNLKSLTPLWNGVMAGISGNAVRYCEAFKPHAWPAAYETLCHDTPIALGVFQKSMLILTTGRPRLVVGSSPEAMDDQPVEFVAACVSARSVVSFGHGVVWATSDGLAYVGTNGAPRLLTDGVMLLDDWKGLFPETIIGTQFNGLYLGFYNTGAALKGFVFDPLKPDEGIRFLSQGYSAAHFDPLSEELYVLDDNIVKRWNAGASNMAASFTTKVYRVSGRNLCFCKVIADEFPCTVTLYADGRAPWVRTVTDGEPFWTPQGFMPELYKIKVATDLDVTGLVLADSIQEINS